MKTLFSLSVLILLLFQGLDANSQTRQTTLYVDCSYKGSTEDGTINYPYKTIRKALDKRQSMGLAGMITDEQIVIKPGKYYPSGDDMLIINRYNSGANGKWLTIKPEIPWTVTIRGDSLYNTIFAAMLTITDSAQYVKIKNLTFEHLRCNPALTNWMNIDGSYTASVPTVVSMYNGNPVKTAYGDTIYEAQKDVKFGIQIAGDSRYINIFDNDISDISWTSAVSPLKKDSKLTENERKILRNAWPNDNAGPISVLGSDVDAMRNIVIDGNEVHHCNPGWTEAISVNGFVDSFAVINNLVHDIKNIGINAAGNYTWILDPGNNFNTPPSENFSRNGVISNNVVYNCLSPIAASAGIYLDGSRNILVERNQLYNNHTGISVGNETPNSHSGDHIIRNNIIYDNVWTGIVLGSNAYNAWVENTKVLNNTFYKNNTRIPTLIPQKDYNGLVIQENGVAVPFTFNDGGEIVTQFLSNSNEAPNSKIEVQNNIFRSRKGILITALQPFRTAGYTGTNLTNLNIGDLLKWDFNLYYIEPGFNNSINYDFASAGFVGNTYNFINYQNTVGLDSNSTAIELSEQPAIDPVFVEGTNFPNRFKLTSASVAYNIGNPSSTNSGTDDFIWNQRIKGGRIDAGAIELPYYVNPISRIVVSDNEASNVTLYPNPVVNSIKVKYLGNNEGSVRLEILDLHGRLILAQTNHIFKGENVLNINNIEKARVVRGNYLLRIIEKERSQTIKFIIE